MGGSVARPEHGDSSSQAWLPVIAHPLSHADPQQNHLLAALPASEWQRWAPQLDWVELKAGQVLSEAGSTPLYAYFPSTAVVSLLYLTQDGASAEFAVVGRDGVVGISLFMGGDTSPGSAVVQGAGLACRVRAQFLREEMRHGGASLVLLLRYVQAMLTQVVQSAACNRYHSIEQQLSRRLLMGLDRATGQELLMTQELLASLLGVRREGVTAAALRLQHAGLIRYSRGRIAVLDRPGLEQHACECYAATRRECERLLPVALAA